MAIRNQRATILAKVKQRASKGSRKKHIRPEPRQYTMVDLDRAQGRHRSVEWMPTAVTASIVVRGYSALSANCA